jgi:2-oxo-4-hydroxy-4-carboxy-5-ureidoimidazoline decarboxylase
MDKQAFVDRFGGVFEHSAWVADRGFDHLNDRDRLNASTVHVALCQAFRAASREERLAVLRAHPDLAGKLAIAGELTEASKAEQAGAGLDRLSAEEYARFTEFNRRYQETFGFPFIVAVKGLDKTDILRAFESRISNTEPDEFATACAEVEKIALIRLQAMFPES